MITEQSDSDQFNLSNQLQILLLIFFFGGFLCDVFFFPIILDWGSDFRLFLIVLVWLFTVRISNFTSRATFKLTLGFLILLSVLFIFFPTYPPTERIASWIYIFLAIGITQQFFENPKKEVM